MKRYIGLILDEDDPADAAIYVVVVAYLAYREPIRETPSDKSVTVVCPYCGFTNSYETQRGARIGMATHIRQMHPEES